MPFANPFGMRFPCIHVMHSLVCPDLTFAKASPSLASPKAHPRKLLSRRSIGPTYIARHFSMRCPAKSHPGPAQSCLCVAYLEPHGRNVPNIYSKHPQPRLQQMERIGIMHKDRGHTGPRHVQEHFAVNGDGCSFREGGGQMEPQYI